MIFPKRRVASQKKSSAADSLSQKLMLISHQYDVMKAAAEYLANRLDSFHNWQNRVVSEQVTLINLHEIPDIDEWRSIKRRAAELLQCEEGPIATPYVPQPAVKEETKK